MQKLVRGIKAFQEKTFAENKELFESLAEGQKPEALFITCSDSRLNPNLLTQTQPGEIFIIRNAGNLIPTHGGPIGGEAGTIEFALLGLGIREIIVCGHSHCGAMKGVLEPSLLKELPTTATWLKNADSTQRIMKENYKHLGGEQLLNATIQENVLVQIENLKTHPAVAALLARGELQIHAWVYKFETGQVFSFDPQEGQFVLLEEATPLLSQKRQLQPVTHKSYN
ncbi:MAG: carbonate dehydratase [Proteobacteria bacterium SG_bin7]|nr:MAG: carbonate dehydratase [Proteobacteria bacterium SG_bin7]